MMVVFYAGRQKKPMGTRLTFLVSKAKYTQRKFESIFDLMSFKIKLDIKLYCC